MSTWRCYAGRSRTTTGASTNYWPNKQKERTRAHERVAVDDRRRDPRRREAKVRGIPRSALPRALGSGADSTVVPGPRGLDHAGLCQRSQTRWKDSLRVVERKRQKLLPD